MDNRIFRQNESPIIFTTDKPIYQWDSHIFLNIDTEKFPILEGSLVHFVQDKSIYSIQPLANKVEIPSQLLKNYGRFNVYAYICTNDNAYTVACNSFIVLERPQPPEYIDDPTPVITYPELVELVDDLNDLKEEIPGMIDEERQERIAADLVLDDKINKKTVTFVWDQSFASDNWIIIHDMNKHPSVTVVDSAGTVIVGEVTYISNSEIHVKFIYPFSGKAYLN